MRCCGIKGLADTMLEAHNYFSLGILVGGGKVATPSGSFSVI